MSNEKEQRDARYERELKEATAALQAALSPQNVPQVPQESPLLLPTDAKERKIIPVGTGVFDYFPAALIEIAKVSWTGNEQHNPGQPLHWARGKSMDHFDTALRHLMERGTIDTDGRRHTAKAGWRIMAMLQQEMEEAGLAPLSRGSRVVR